jgi:hypothetical protein
MSGKSRAMSGHRQSRSYSSRSAGVLLLVGVVVGATVGGFAVVRATSGSSSASSFVPVSPVRVLVLLVWVLLTVLPEMLKLILYKEN